MYLMARILASQPYLIKPRAKENEKNVLRYASLTFIHSTYIDKNNMLYVETLDNYRHAILSR